MGWWLLWPGDCYWQVKPKPHKLRVAAIAQMLISQSNNSLVKLDTNLFGDYQLIWLLRGFWQIVRQSDRLTRALHCTSSRITTTLLLRFPISSSFLLKHRRLQREPSHRIFAPQQSNVTRTYLTFSNP
ncbi:MAG TPA: hypothetical protein V6D48_09190 [Oculatellaceae cyanobacterium]